MVHPEVCPSGKYGWWDRRKAEAMLRVIRRRKFGHRVESPKSSYRCPHCHAWHLTSQRERPR